MNVDGAKTSIRLHHLRKYTTYMLWVSASTSVGEGPMSEKHSYTTAEDGTTFFFYFLTPFLICGGVGFGAAPKGMVFAPFWSESGYRLCPFWSGIGYGFRGNYGSVWT